MTQPQPPPQQQQPSQGQLAVAVAAVLVVATSAAAAAATLAPLFLYAKIRRDALEAALGVVLGMPPDAAGFHGPATAQAARLNLMRRAQFVVASARRLTGDLVTARSQGTSLAQALRDGIARERRYYGLHLVAGWTRSNAAAQVDSAAADYGLLLGWYTRIDTRTSPECLAANKHNFRADDMPLIGFPGAVHPHCRCSPGPPFPGAALVDAARFGARGKRPVSVHRPQHQPAYAGQRR